MQLANRIERIEISSTLAVLQEAERLRAQGADVVDFGPGEPDFPTPDHIKQAAIRAMEQNYTKYTPAAGIGALRKAICEWHGEQLGSSYEPAECIASAGGKHAIFNVLSVLINAGDEVIVPAPYWVSFPDIVKYAGGKPVFAGTSARDGFRLRAEQVKQALTPKTKLVIVNSPNNPTGAVVEPEEFARIFELTRANKSWLLSDECYSHFTYAPARPFSAASLAGAKLHLIVAGSLSKTFAMTGWRIGYALAPAPLVAAMTKLQSQSTSNPNSIAQYAAVAALKGPMDSVATMLAEYGRRRKRIVEGLAAIPGIECHQPDGAFYVFPKIQSGANGKAADTTGLAKQLLERAHVAVVPGEAFGAPGYLRISYATSLERIEEGLKRLRQFFASTQATP